MPVSVVETGSREVAIGSAALLGCSVEDTFQPPLLMPEKEVRVSGAVELESAGATVYVT